MRTFALLEKLVFDKPRVHFCVVKKIGTILTLPKQTIWKKKDGKTGKKSLQFGGLGVSGKEKVSFMAPKYQSEGTKVLL